MNIKYTTRALHPFPVLLFYFKNRVSLPTLCLSFPCLYMLLSQHSDNVNKTYDFQYLIKRAYALVKGLYYRSDYVSSTIYGIALAF